MKGKRDRTTLSRSRQDLALNAESEHVRMKASMDILDRSGFKPLKRQEVQHVSRSVKEIVAELVRLIGGN